MLSVASNSVLTAAKLLVGLMTGSVSVLSEGLHSGNDLVAALLALFSVRKSNQAPDAGHAYGHGKFEALSGAIEALLICVAALGIAYTAVRALVTGSAEAIQHGPAVVVMGVSAVVNIFVSRRLYRVARQHDSLALHADAAHLTCDVWTSAGVFVGLGAAYLLEERGLEVHWLDPALAVGVAVLVMGQGWRIAWDAVAQLLDRSLPAEELAIIEGIIRDHAGQFVEFHKLRTRRAGHERHVDLHLVVCSHLSVAEAHGLADHLETEIARELPGTQVMIHTEPGDGPPCGDGQQSEDSG